MEIWLYSQFDISNTWLDYNGRLSGPSFFFYQNKDRNLQVAIWIRLLPLLLLFQSNASAVAKPFSGHFWHFKMCRFEQAKNTVINWTRGTFLSWLSTSCVNKKIKKVFAFKKFCVSCTRKRLGTQCYAPLIITLSSSLGPSRSRALLRVYNSSLMLRIQIEANRNRR